MVREPSRLTFKLKSGNRTGKLARHSRDPRGPSIQFQLSLDELAKRRCRAVPSATGNRSIEKEAERQRERENEESGAPASFNGFEDRAKHTGELFVFNDLSGAQGNSRGRGLPIFREIKPAQESAVANRGPPTVFRIPLISFYSFSFFFSFWNSLAARSTAAYTRLGLPRLVDKSDDGCGTSTARRFRATFLSFLLLLLLLRPFPCISAGKLLKFVATRRKICTRARCRIVGRCAPTNFSLRILPVSLFLFFSRPIDVVSRLNIAHVSRFCQVFARSNFLSQGFVTVSGCVFERTAK